MTFLTCLDYPEEDNHFKTVQWEMLPKIREFNTSSSHLLRKKLLDVKVQDGRPYFGFMDSISFKASGIHFKEEENIRCLLEKAKLLEKLHLSVDS